ncbi:hypothetical protein ILP92_10120 [Maribius pontilimi]|uniref:Uncharacterized protein n=1 Tax=Palleronia pontilimi TaxID=1964209 RepID=A0A934IIB9_9RHOB|nr:hypothetical protein [Palleronia pontilimi]MBJ3763100.1 hypothetical protein [Palleronia pontilimi]
MFFLDVRTPLYRGGDSAELVVLMICDSTYYFDISSLQRDLRDGGIERTDSLHRSAPNAKTAFRMPFFGGITAGKQSLPIYPVQLAEAVQNASFDYTGRTFATF